MANIRESLETNKRILTVLAVILVVMGIFLYKFYTTQKNENLALRIKIMSMQENRKNPKPWSELLVKPLANANALVAKAPPPAQMQTPENTADTTDNEDTQELAVKLSKAMRKIKDLDATEMDKNIVIAEEIISREPDSYSAYKAKLISLLTKEGKFNRPVDEVEVESILESMAQFNLSSDKLARREAALIANRNSDILNVEAQMDEVASLKENVESRLAELDPNSQEFANLNLELDQLDEREKQLISNVETLENNLENNTAQLVNEDVVEIPFMRLMAKNEYDAVIDNAQALIEQFPNSASGYFYMVKALEMQGEKDQALQVIQDSRLPEDAQQALLHRLDSEGEEDPKNYWQKLSF